MLWGMVLRLERYLMDGVLLVCDMWNGIMCQIGQCIVCCLFFDCLFLCVFPYLHWLSGLGGIQCRQARGWLDFGPLFGLFWLDCVICLDHFSCQVD